jgi:UDP-N-acetylglucosamine--N-acetylmuramyl-(pentapeptide) pyrophosphoryl-undecaprenol N-acetylglucosamine transferase
MMAGDGDRRRLLLTGGGTGGHLFPAVATAEEMCRRLPGTEVLFVGTRRKVDSGSLAAYGFPAETIYSYGLKGKKPRELVKALFALPVGYLQALRLVRRFRPDLIFAVGGYVTGPVVLAGKSLGVPVVIHEQNSVPGLANRKLGPLADRICLSLPGSGSAFDPAKTILTGNPVRQEILAQAELSAAAEKGGPPTLLVLGGSQGAEPVNRLVGEAVSHLAAAGGVGFRLVHQSGERDAASLIDLYRQCRVEAQVAPFFRDMAALYGQADLLVSRAGATTLAEAAVVGKPALLIPYPHAADNHQEKNAAYYVAGGGALQFREGDLCGEVLATEIARLLADPPELRRMGEAMRRLAFPDAAARIVTCCLDTMERSR